jgi:hypothetical protein
MAQCVNSNPEGFIVLQAQSVDECTGYILVSPTEYSLAVQSIEITSSELLEVFGIVFGWVILLGAISYYVKVATKLIKIT